MNKDDQEQDNNPKPQTFTPSKKVFDVVRPGKSPASATSRPVISSHKPQVPDDQFVPSANTRLASNPSEKHPLMDGGKKLALSPLSDDAMPDKEAVDEAVSEPVAKETTAPTIHDRSDKPAEPQDTPELLPDHFDDEPLTPDSPAPTQPSTEAKPATAEEQASAPAEKPTPEQLAVGQVVTTDDELPSFDAPTQPSDKPMTQDDVLAETDAPLLDHAIVSHHKHRTKLWEWLLIFLLIVFLALVALNFLLDAEVLTTDLGIPHTDLLKDN